MTAIRDIVMPKLGLTMTEGTLSEWMIAPGSAVRAGDTLFVVETEKVANEVKADQDGVIDTLLIDAGQTVPVGTPVARLRGDQNAVAATAVVPAKEAPPIIAAKIAPNLAPLVRPDGAPSTDGGRVIATPYARRLARNAGIDLSQMRGSGPRGRIKAADVEAAIQPAAGQAPDKGRRLQPATTGAAHIQMMAELPAARLAAMQAELRAARPPTDVPLLAFAAAAIARAIRDLGPEKRHALGIASIDIAVMAANAAGTREILVAHADTQRLSQIAARIVDSEQPPASNAGAVAIVADSGHAATRFYLPALPNHALLSAGIGSVFSQFRPGANGEPVAHETIGFSMTVHNRAGADLAAQLYAAITRHLEHPLPMLATH